MRKIQKILCVLFCGILLSGCGKAEYTEGTESLKAGAYEKAIRQFEASAEKEYRIADSYCGIAFAKWELKDYQGTVDALEKAVENGAEPTGSMYNMIAASKMNLEDYSDAMEAYDAALLEEDCTEEMIREIKFNQIVICEKTGELETAKEKLAEYVKEYPDDGQAAKEAEFFSTR